MKNNHLLLFGVLALLTGSSFATLGESVASIKNDVKILNATVVKSAVSSKQQQNQASSNLSYSVSEFQTDNGVQVKEYVANGAVFAISWAGAVFPNLRQLYGGYFSSYSQGKSLTQSLRLRTINTAALFAQSSGVSGKFTGKIILKDKLPANLSIHDIK